MSYTLGLVSFEVGDEVVRIIEADNKTSLSSLLMLYKDRCPTERNNNRYSMLPYMAGWLLRKTKLQFHYTYLLNDCRKVHLVIHIHNQKKIAHKSEASRWYVGTYYCTELTSCGNICSNYTDSKSVSGSDIIVEIINRSSGFRDNSTIPSDKRLKKTSKNQFSTESTELCRSIDSQTIESKYHIIE